MAWPPFYHKAPAGAGSFLNIVGQNGPFAAFAAALSIFGKWAAKNQMPITISV